MTGNHGLLNGFRIVQNLQRLRWHQPRCSHCMIEKLTRTGAGFAQ